MVKNENLSGKTDLMSDWHFHF